MNANTRTDIHRPSAIVPGEYSYVCVHYSGLAVDFMATLNADATNWLRIHMDRTGGKFSHHDHGGSCGICGAHAASLATFWHEPSNTYIKTGLDCAEKLDMANEDAFRIFRAKRQKALDAHRRALANKAGKAKAEALLKDADLEKAWEIYEMPWSDLEQLRLPGEPDFLWRRRLDDLNTIYYIVQGATSTSLTRPVGAGAASACS